MQTFDKNIDLLVESSWEVCNKIGGIYTVLSTKAAELQHRFGDRLVFFGPDVWTEEQPSPDFVERKRMLQKASQLEFPFDIKIRTGRWKIPGSPQVVLIDFKGVYSHLDEIFGEMWREYGVDSLHGYGDYNEGCAFAVACAVVTKTLASHLGVAAEKTVAHFNEWTTGMGLLYLKSKMPGAATLFTTHATTIGRSICGNGKPLYEFFEAYDGDQMAAELNVQSKHSLEKAAAHNADCFTTVSDVTARECTQLLGITPAVITPNGFEPSFVPDDAKWSRLRSKGRKKILRIASLLYGRKFEEDSYIVATSGRNEYRNKGLDLFIDATYRLGEMAAASSRSVIALVLVPAWVSEANGDLLIDVEHNGSVRPNPDYLTHRLHNEDTDAVACSIRRHKEMAGGASEIPNIYYIYVPCYLDGHDGIVNISYYNLLPAVDISLFGSYYEPWGYTPLESVAFGVPTVTTDKAGFGQWAEANFQTTVEESGVAVVPRNDSNYSEATAKIAEILADYMGSNASAVETARKAARATAAKAEWKYFIKDYEEAFSVALRHATSRAVSGCRQDAGDK